MIPGARSTPTAASAYVVSLRVRGVNAPCVAHHPHRVMRAFVCVLRTVVGGVGDVQEDVGFVKAQRRLQRTQPQIPRLHHTAVRRERAWSLRATSEAAPAAAAR